MFDSGANFPGSGVISDGNLLHHTGSFTGCLNVNKKYFSEDVPKVISWFIFEKRISKYNILHFKAQYCLITYTSDVEAHPLLDPVSAPTWRFHEHIIPDRVSLARRTGYLLTEGKYHADCRPLNFSSSPLMTETYKVGKCLPYECSKDDIRKIVASF